MSRKNKAENFSDILNFYGTDSDDIPISTKRDLELYCEKFADVNISDLHGNYQQDSCDRKRSPKEIPSSEEESGSGALPPASPDAVPTPYRKSRASSMPSKSRKLSMLELADILLKRFTIVNVRNALWRYEPPLYQRVSTVSLLDDLRTTLPPEAAHRLTMKDIEDTFKCLLSFKEIEIEDFSAPTTQFVAENGVFNIKNFRKCVPSPEAYHISSIRANFLGRDLPATPVFDAFLDRASGGNAQIGRRIMEFLGYCLIPGDTGKAYFVLGTASDSGKSILALFLQRLLGNSNCSNVSIHDMGENFAMAPLVGKSLNISMDLQEGTLKRKAVSILKNVTGGDAVTVNEKFVPMFSYVNRAKFVFGTNHPITIAGDDTAFWDRCIIVPFLFSIPKEEQDKELLEKLWEERDAIVTKAIHAVRRVVVNNYQFSPCDVADAMKNSWAGWDSDVIAAFVSECCVLSSEERVWTSDLLDTFSIYCQQSIHAPVTGNTLLHALQRKPYGCRLDRWRKNGSNSRRGLVGIGLRSA